MLYRQTLRVKAVNLQDSSVITLMGTDVERIVVSFKSIHEVWASLIDISIAVYLLERQLFVACVVPALIAAGDSSPFEGLEELADSLTQLAFWL